MNSDKSYFKIVQASELSSAESGSYIPIPWSKIENTFLLATSVFTIYSSEDYKSQCVILVKPVSEIKGYEGSTISLGDNIVLYMND